MFNKQIKEYRYENFTSEDFKEMELDSIKFDNYKKLLF